MNGRIHLKTAAALSNDWGPLPFMLCIRKDRAEKL